MPFNPDSAKRPADAGAPTTVLVSLLREMCRDSSTRDDTSNLFAIVSIPQILFALRKYFPSIERSPASICAHDAVMVLVKAPVKCTASTDSDIVAFLYTIAKRRVIDEVRDQARWGKHQDALTAAMHTVQQTDGVDQLSTLIAREGQRLAAVSLSEPLAKLFPDAVERAVLWLMLHGERSTAAYALVLGITHLPVAEQRKVVKKAKDRINKKLMRAGGLLTDPR